MKRFTIISLLLLLAATFCVSAEDEQKIHGSVSLYSYIGDLSADASANSVNFYPYLILSYGKTGVSTGVYWLSNLSDFSDPDYSFGYLYVWEQYAFKLGKASVAFGNKNGFNLEGSSIDTATSGSLYLKARYPLSKNVTLVNKTVGTYYYSGKDYSAKETLGLAHALPLGPGTFNTDVYQIFTLYPEIAASQTYFDIKYTLAFNNGISLQTYLRPTFTYKNSEVSAKYPLYFVVTKKF